MARDGAKHPGGKYPGGRDAGARRERLHRFLCDLVARVGRIEATKLLGVNYRTLVSAQESGELTGRMSDALERLLLTWDGGPVAGPGAGDDDVELEPDGDLSQRVAALEAGLDELARELRSGLDAVRAAVGGAAQADRASGVGKPGVAQPSAKPGCSGAVPVATRSAAGGRVGVGSGPAVPPPASVPGPGHPGTRRR